MTAVTDPSAIRPFLLALRSKSRAATKEEAASVQGAADELSRVLPPIEPPDAAPVSTSSSKPWLPRFRSPDRLFRLYCDPDWSLSVRPDDAALFDLAALALPVGLDQVGFDRWVRQELLSSPIVAALDVLLDRPQRFGALSAAVGETMPEADREGMQAVTQVLIRWLTHFAPDRYGLTTPNHSEVLFKR
jgi:hypothetical protein